MAIAAPFPENERARLEALYSYQILDTPDQEEFDRITSLASEVLEAPIALVSLVDASRQWFKSKCGLGASETPRDIAFCAHAILGEEIFLIPDATKDRRFHDSPLVTGPPHIRTYVGAPLIDREGFAVGTLCVIYDEVTHLDNQQLSRLRRLADVVVDELLLRRALVEADTNAKLAKAANKSKSDFLAAMSHELRTPMNAIIGFAQVLQKMGHHTGSEETRAEYLGYILDGGNQLLGLINDLLDINDIEIGRTKVSPEPFEILSVVKNVHRMLAKEAEEKSLDLQLNATSDMTVNADRQRCRQIIANLLNNAIKYTEKGSIEIGMREQGDYIEVFVKDTGSGIKPSDLARIFEKFARVEEDPYSASQYGFGLGLHISKVLTEAMGGRLSATSEVGAGSTFTLSLPKAA